MNDRLKRLAALAVLCLAPAIAPASPLILQFSFIGDGRYEQGDSCGFFCLTTQVQGTVLEIGDEIPGTDSWSFEGVLSLFDFPEPFPDAGAGILPAGGWSFTDPVNGNDLFGSFFVELGSDLVEIGGNLFRQGSVLYLVQGGAGLFLGAGGHGSSSLLMGLNNDTWFELGTMTVAVPEPGTLALLLAGLLGMGFVALRRRAQPVRVR